MKIAKAYPLYHKVRRKLEAAGYSDTAKELKKLILPFQPVPKESASSSKQNASVLGKLYTKAAEKTTKIHKKIEQASNVLYKTGKNKLRPAWWFFKKTFRIYDEQDRALRAYRNTHLGESCFIVGNGSSLTVADLERISEKGFVCFGSNKIHKIFEKTAWRPNYYVCIDRPVFEQNVQDILLDVECPVFLEGGLKDITLLFEDVFQKTASQVRYFRYHRLEHKEPFCPNGLLLYGASTVTFTAIEIAWMMGFRTIYLIGCDHCYQAFSNLPVGQRMIPASPQINSDYFTSDYLRPGEVMSVGELDKAARGYQSARNYITTHGGKIYNATRGGELEVFERVSLDDILTHPFSEFP